MLYNRRADFNLTWKRGTTATVNDLFLACDTNKCSNLSVTHEMLNGSDHRLLKFELSYNRAHMHLNYPEIQVIEQDNGADEVDDDDDDVDDDS